LYREAGDDGVIVRKPAIAADFRKLREQSINVIEHGGPAGMAGDEHALPRRQVLVDVAADRLHAPVQAVDRTQAIRRRRQHRQRFDLFQQHCNRFFEFKRIGRHVSSLQCRH